MTEIELYAHAAYSQYNISCYPLHKISILIKSAFYLFRPRSHVPLKIAEIFSAFSKKIRLHVAY